MARTPHNPDQELVDGPQLSLALPCRAELVIPPAPPVGIAHPEEGERRGVLELIEDHDRGHVVLVIDDVEVCRLSASQAQRLCSMLFWCGQRVGDFKRARKGS